MSRPLYEHTQVGWPIRIAFLVAALVMLIFAATPLFNQLRAPPLVLVLGAIVSAVLGWVWGALTVRIKDGALQLCYGPGWPRKNLPLKDIVDAEVTRTTFADGWGIHRTRRGWLYNVSGYEAVLLRLGDDRAVLVGSDEPRRLKAALQRALQRA